MQDRYAGDVGDYIKLALLRALSPGTRLGIAWYLYPNETHNLDGRHVRYLIEPKVWRHLDEELFDKLKDVVSIERSVGALERMGIVQATYYREPVAQCGLGPVARNEARVRWFQYLCDTLSSCDLIFADPDNGIIDMDPIRRGTPKFGKHMPLDEVEALSQNRTLIVYHHNSRFKGGHDLEVEHWLKRIGLNGFAIRANAFSCRTFFVINPTEDISRRAIKFCHHWAAHKVRYHAPGQETYT